MGEAKRKKDAIDQMGRRVAAERDMILRAVDHEALDRALKAISVAVEGMGAASLAAVCAHLLAPLLEAQAPPARTLLMTAIFSISAEMIATKQGVPADWAAEGAQELGAP